MQMGVDFSQYSLLVLWSGKRIKMCVASLEVGISWSICRIKFFHGKLLF